MLRSTNDDVDLRVLVRHLELDLLEGIGPGTSVSPVADLTYSRIHFSLRLATSSQHKIRSSARYMFAVNTSFVSIIGVTLYRLLCHGVFLL
jgi:hypothetical protein